MRRLAALTAVLAIAACNPPDQAVPVSGDPAPTEDVVRVAAIDKPVLVDGDRFHNVTTTTSSTVAPTTVPVPTVPPPSEPPPAPAPVEVRDVSSSGSVWDRLAQCESHGEWDYGPHSTWGSRIYEGGLQFHPRTWDAYKPAGYPARAYQASREQQIVVGERVLAAQGWGAWPHCSRVIGVR